jgi:hypothetical protein
MRKELAEERLLMKVGIWCGSPTISDEQEDR